MQQTENRISLLEDNLNKVVLGKPEVVRMCTVVLLSGEHMLLEDVPGVGKTLVGKALAKSISGDFCRLQFTPDLLPSDIVGSSVYKSTTSEFLFNKGPVFNNIVLADEINRAPPRTQSALLEAMSDQQVSADGKTYTLPNPFMVIATQNPFEFEGTYVLPESQLDRFLVRISMGYPSAEFERQVLTSHRMGQPVDDLQSVLSLEDVAEMQSAVKEVKVDDAISDYVLEVVNRTRTADELEVGVSTRGALLWYRAAQANAFAEGRDYVIPDDAKKLAVAVLGHRVLGKGFVQDSNRGELNDVIRRIVDDVPTPN